MILGLSRVQAYKFGPNSDTGPSSHRTLYLLTITLMSCRLPDASVDPASVADDIKNVGAIGAGGVEFLPYYNVSSLPHNIVEDFLTKPSMAASLENL